MRKKRGIKKLVTFDAGWQRIIEEDSFINSLVSLLVYRGQGYFCPLF